MTAPLQAKRIYGLVLGLWVVYALSACSTGESKKDSSTSASKTQGLGSSEASQPDSVEKTSSNEASDSSAAQTDDHSLIDSTQNSTGKLDKKYAELAQAVRSGRSNSILDSAAKILSSNQSDAVALNALALYHLRKGHVGAAKLLINRAFEKNETSAALYNNFGVILLAEGDSQGAMVSFKKALKYDDKHPQALGNLGSLYVQAGDLSKAKSLLEPAYQQMHASNLGVATNYAITLRAGKDFDGAKRVYEELLKQNSREVSVLLNYATLLIDSMNKPKEGLALVYKVKFIETDKRDVLDRANALEKKAKSELK